MRGHIQLFPAALKAVFDSEAWATKFKFKRRPKVRGQTPIRYPGILEIDEDAKLKIDKRD